jgi:hypothetical protein
MGLGDDRARQLCVSALAVSERSQWGTPEQRARLRAAKAETLRWCHQEGCGAEALTEAKAAFQSARKEGLTIAPTFGLVGRWVEP